MNKELKALENMRADVIDFRDIIENPSFSTDADYELIKNVLKRNELMLVEDKFDDNDYEFSRGFCPNCQHIVYKHDNYCCDCGQKLDWSDDDETTK